MLTADNSVYCVLFSCRLYVMCSVVHACEACIGKQQYVTVHF